MHRARVVRGAAALAACLFFLGSCGGDSDPQKAAEDSASPAPDAADADLAFSVSVPKAQRGLYTVGVDGEGLERVAGAGASPDWSPDGSRIVYVDGSPPQIWVMNADGSGKERLTDYDDGAQYPAWSHDGQRIAFIRGHWADTSDFPEAVEIYVMDADGSRQRRVTRNEQAEASVTWSPDGDALALTRSGSDFGPGLAVVDLATGEEVDVTPEDAPPDHGIDWSPATDRLVYTSSLSGTSLWTMTPEGKDLQELRVDDSVQPRSPAWSPDGAMIAFTGESVASLYGSSGAAQVSELYVMGADGDEMELVVDDRWLILTPDWVPR